MLRIVHVDMDAFFASVEQRDHPELRGLPVVVGGSPKGRGVVSTASYEARRFGIRSAMPAAEAYARCPQAIFVRPNFRAYEEASRQIQGIFHDYSDLVEPMSLDEAYIDVTGQDAVAIGRRIKERIHREVRLTASVGVSYNKFLAKIASDLEKPGGFTVIDEKRAAELLPTLPVRKLPGVGAKSEDELQRIGIYTVADLQRSGPELLTRLFGRRGLELAQLAQGIDERPVGVGGEAKSISEETTFDQDVKDRTQLEQVLSQYADSLCRQLVRGGLRIRTVTIKARYEDFTNITRSFTLPDYTCDPDKVRATAFQLLDKVDLAHHRVRLIGLHLANFLQPGEPYQMRFGFLSTD
ncbi:MAG: DNA polymerase IV [Chloroflexota bacterium]